MIGLRSDIEIRPTGRTTAPRPDATGGPVTGCGCLGRWKPATGKRSWPQTGRLPTRAGLVVLGVTVALVLAIQTGCKRSHYRVRADADAYSILGAKTNGRPWMPPPNFSVLPHPASRFCDPTPIDCPTLPIPAPQLYAYRLPDLPKRNRSGKSPSSPPPADRPPSESPESLPEPSGPTIGPAAHVGRLPSVPRSNEPSTAAIRRIGFEGPLGTTFDDQDVAAVREGGASELRLLPRPEPLSDGDLSRLPPVLLGPAETFPTGQRGESDDGNRLPSVPPEGPLQDVPAELVPWGENSQRAEVQPQRALSGANDRTTARSSFGSEVRLAAIPPDAWQTIPESCRTRMYEFESLRDEYLESFEHPVPSQQRDTSQKLTLEDIVDIALINSREYQTQKESLYRVALRLSLDRFEYDLKFSPDGHRTTADWRHDRNAGITENRLGIPTSVQAEKALLTGGDLLARFANSVVLTFNGPQGFAADVGSDLLLDISQPLLQRDIRFERLTQSERDVVYAARNFTRFRKELFVQLAGQYYGLIRTYRQIEIEAQNYFTLVRAFHQANAEFRAGLLPRLQVDQVEQDVLRGQSTLIATCNGFESSLDNLKLLVGLPTETPINLNLDELEQVTLRDELAVTGEMIRRVRRRLDTESSSQNPDIVVLLSTTVVLAERILDSYRLQTRLGEQPPESGELLDLRAELRVEAGRINARNVRQQLEQETGADPLPLSVEFQRTLDLSESLLRLVDRQLELADLRFPDAEALKRYRQEDQRLQQRAAELDVELENLITEAALDQLQTLIARARQLRQQAEQLVENIERQLGAAAEPPTPEQELQTTIERAEILSQLSEQVLTDFGGGLTPIEIDMDEAMLTALVLRLELMNERGALADDWRQIKLAADDLRSVLNLNASHTIRTRRDVNRAFDFTWDEGSTQVQLTFDAPLNRRAQRNLYRNTLIDYQAGLRRLMALEDVSKLQVRDNLRDLALQRTQYAINVASAALAFERVVSTGLELRLGIGQVAARDFLEAQTAYTRALSSVASDHIDYIRGRIDLFLNTELLTVDASGFWPELYDEEYQPTAQYQLPNYAAPAYGQLPPVCYSKEIKRMRCIPNGTSAIHRPRPESSDPPQAESPESLVPPPPLPPRPRE